MFDSVAPMTAIVALLTAVPGMGAVQIGAPLSWSKKTSAYVTLGQQPSDIKTAGGTVWRDAHYFVDIGYRCDDDLSGVSEAETVLGAALDALQRAVYADKTLGGTVQDTHIDTGLADEPEYRQRAGSEYREFPLVLICRQYDTFKSVV